MRASLLFVVTAGAAAAAAAEEPAWKGSLGLSYLATSGNSDTSAGGLKLELTRVPQPWGLSAVVEASRAEQDGTATAERYVARLRGERALGERWSLFAGAGGERDRFAGFDRRLTVESGAVYRALTGPRHTLAFDAGLTWTEEKLVAGATTDFAGAVAGLAYAFAISPTASLTERLLYLPNFDVSSDWRLTSETALAATLTSRLALKLGYTVRYDNEPIFGFDDTDTATTVSLVLAL